MANKINDFRVIIVDFMPLVHSYLHGGAPRLSKVVNINGQPTTIDTTIQNYTIKAIHRWSNGGAYPIAVCFDSPCPCRKQYFKSLKQVDKNGDSIDYKDARDKLPSTAFDGIDMTAGLLKQGGVSVYKAENYESDDLIKACVDKAKDQFSPTTRAKEQYFIDRIHEVYHTVSIIEIKPLLDCLLSVHVVNRPLGDYTTRLTQLFPKHDVKLLDAVTKIVLGMSDEEKIKFEEYIRVNKANYPIVPIDIICNDADLLPLVDDQVSVFYRTKKMAWAETKELLKPKYIQVTPANFQEVVEGISSYKNLSVPYNSVLLAKLLRGDKSDKVLGHPSWTPKVYKQLVEILEDNVEDIAGLFRYGGEQQLEEICSVLGKYIEEEDLEHIRKIYTGINLNGRFTGLPEGMNREPALITSPITPYKGGRLQQVITPLGINLNV